MVVEAAGGVVWRQRRDRVEVLLVHRPDRDDWSLPKGRREDGETWLTCALREVREETGLRCEVGVELPETSYIDRRGRDKRVRYWAMTPKRGKFRPNDEVDQVRWVRADKIAKWLTNSRDIPVVEALVGTAVTV